MPSYISKDGVCRPAIEKVALVDKNGEPFIYDGPDRAATEYLKTTGEDHLGMPFWEDPEIIDRAHERRKTVEEFCKTSIHTKEKREKEYAEKVKEKVLHKLPTRKPMQKASQSGGMNTAGGGHLEGGFTASNGSAIQEAIDNSKVK